MDRRAFLAAAPALSLSAVPAPAQAVDSHPDWLRQWRALRDAWRAAEADTPAEQALWRRAEAFAEQILSAPVRTPQGAAARLRYLVEDDHFQSLSENIGEQDAHRVIREIAAALDASDASKREVVE